MFLYLCSSVFSELATFIRRLWTLFERLDFVGHGKGCNILLRAMKLLKTEKPDVIDMSHLVLVAADMDSTVFAEKYIDEVYRFVKRITIYVNTWDWKLWSQKYWNWSSERVGAKLMGGNGKFDCIDVTQLIAGWFTSNHYYLTDPFFKLDLIQALSKVGGVDPKYRNYVLPVYSNGSGLLDNTVAYHELVDKPYMKVVPEKKQNVNRKKEVLLEEAKQEESGPVQQKESEDNDEDEKEVDPDDFVANYKIIARNLTEMGYVFDERGSGDASRQNAELESVVVR